MKYNGIIIFGEMGSGKDTLADILMSLDNRLKKYGLGDVMRMLKKISTVDPKWFKDERTFMQTCADKLREIDINILNHYALARMFEENLDEYELTKENYRSDLDNLFKRIKLEKNVIPIIVGGRTYADYDYWKNIGFATVGILISNETRIERLITRDGKTVADNSDSTHNTEKDVRDIIQKCEFKVSNDGTLEDLKNESENLLKILE